MLVSEAGVSVYQVRYSSYLLPLILLSLPPLMLIELGPGLLEGSLKTGEQISLALGVLLPLMGAYYLTEFASFTFSRDDGLLTWRWRNLVVSRSGEVPFDNIAQVRRDALETGDADGLQYSYRLVVILNDGSVIPLTRGFSGLYGRKLDQIVDQIRDFIDRRR
jgi:hypothetical protein